MEEAIVRGRRLGKRAPRHDARTLHFSDYLRVGAAVLVPTKVDYVSKVPNIGPLLNDDIGDCTIAGALHLTQVWTFFGDLSEDFVPTDLMALQEYSRVCGYRPTYGPDGKPLSNDTDQGGVLLDVLNEWRKSGLAGHKIDAFAKVNMRSTLDVRAAIYLFGGVYSGIGLPISAQRQRVWALARGPDSEIYSWGGHCVNLCAYSSRYLTCMTWGAAQRMTYGFMKYYFDEGYVPLSLQWLDKVGGHTPTGLDLAALREDLQKIATPV
jgi:hypothetical protein